MNKVILMGRLTKDPEVRYTQSTQPVAIVRYTLAVNRRFKRDGEADADFINIVSFGRDGEFVEKYFKKGQLISVVGRLQIRTYDDSQGNRRWFTEVVTEEVHFAESKSSFEQRKSMEPNETSVPAPENNNADGFVPIDESFDDDLPF
ncbi:single-stranded DNA-binding protein [Vallitalea guaymasensis]|uniref:Single-stranded DNA-binding protein n=1 Tax=Vallitalea guaymasensis TaxID=1185412 RepID=A0A8J8MAW1_9FIRM|nr:single-stranded DNA-binding protein [Vallitalea guaymasensis]QUH29479.1 single-stranded DNA-binding protein [Vallitalea guaymasensis]